MNYERTCASVRYGIQTAITVEKGQTCLVSPDTYKPKSDGGTETI